MKDEVILHDTRRGCAQGKNHFIILPCKPAGIFLHKNWILIYMSINAPRNLIIWNFINLSWNCRYSPRGNSQGNTALICQPHVMMGHKKGVGGRRNRVTYWGFAVSGWRLDSPEESERTWCLAGLHEAVAWPEHARSGSLATRSWGRMMLWLTLNARTCSFGLEAKEWHIKFESSK